MCFKDYRFRQLSEAITGCSIINENENNNREFALTTLFKKVVARLIVRESKFKHIYNEAPPLG